MWSSSQAYQLLRVSSPLCRGLTNPLESQLRAMLMHAKHFGTAPNLVPVDPENFQCSRNQRIARCKGLFSRVSLTRKSQFLHKVFTLAELVEELALAFSSPVGELEQGDSMHPEHEIGRPWRSTGTFRIHTSRASLWNSHLHS